MYLLLDITWNFMSHVLPGFAFVGYLHFYRPLFLAGLHVGVL